VPINLGKVFVLGAILVAVNGSAAALWSSWMALGVAVPLTLLLVFLFRTDTRLALAHEPTEFEENERMLRTLIERQEPYVFYLRSFSMERPVFPSFLLGVIGTYFDRREGTQIERGTVVDASPVPVFGFADPGDLSRARGMYRLLEQNEEFPERLGAFLQNATLIVLSLDARTPGVLKELDILATSESLRAKTIVLLADDWTDSPEGFLLVTGPGVGKPAAEWTSDYRSAIREALGRTGVLDGLKPWIARVGESAIRVLGYSVLGLSILCVCLFLYFWAAL
jgi:hypothetical protein